MRVLAGSVGIIDVLITCTESRTRGHNEMEYILLASRHQILAGSTTLNFFRNIYIHICLYGSSYTNASVQILWILGFYQEEIA